MTRDYADYIDDIIDALDKLQRFTSHMTFSRFQADPKTQFAVIRALEIIGEAAKKIPNTIKKDFPDVPWKEMSGMRDNLAHEYFGVKLEVVWETIKKETPPLKPMFIKIKQSIS